MIEFLRAACIFPSYAFAELQAVAEMLGMPVVTTFKGKGAFPENHPLSMGPIGMHGHAEANKIMVEADCVLAVGTRFSDRSVGTVEDFEKRLKIIHIDVDPAEIGKNQTANVAVVGDVRASLRIMLSMLAKKTTHENTVWSKHALDLKSYWKDNLKIHPGEMGAVLCPHIAQTAGNSTTGTSGLATLAPMAAGNPHPIVPSPVELKNVPGCITLKNNEAHI